jgi:hypothetical protein
LDYNAKLDAYNAQVRRHNQNLDDDEDPVPLAKPRTIIFQPGLIGGKLPSGGKNVAADMSQVWIGDFDVHNSLHVRRAEDLVPAIVRVTPGDYAVITLRETPSNANFSNLGALPVSTEPLQAGVSLVSVGYAGDFEHRGCRRQLPRPSGQREWLDFPRLRDRARCLRWPAAYRDDQRNPPDQG